MFSTSSPSLASLKQTEADNSITMYLTRTPSSMMYLPRTPSSMGFPLQAYGSHLSEEMRNMCHGHGVSGSESLILDSSKGELVSTSEVSLKQLLQAKALAASKSHSEAERRRRERINTHLSTLKTLLPKISKTDKASLLAEVIRHMKDLKEKTTEITRYCTVPSDTDELKVEYVDEGKTMGKASVCCDDRAHLSADLMGALQAVGVDVVRAEICTVAGRAKHDFLLKFQPNNVSLDNILQALRVVAENGVLSGQRNNSACRISNKRPKLDQLNHS